ncbi:MAG: hypothetical protein KDA85_03570, partial [Planctomycetaceae bacterium]|nr:hypothetical protein [Planctomycetaceae bacterium]
VEEWIGAELAGRVKVVPIPGTDLSSTTMRERIRNGRNLRFMTPRAVEAFILQHGIYRQR